MNRAAEDGDVTGTSSESTAPSIGENHPAALAFHALHNAAQILHGDYLDEKDLVRVRELLGEGTAHAGALNVLLQRQERTIEEQRIETLREKQYSTRVEDKNSELVQSVLALTRELEAARRPITPDAPRVAAAGASVS